MHKAAIMAGVLLAIAASQGRAQDAPAAAEVRRLLQSAPNPDDFADLSSGGLVSLRHKPSGLICAFGPDFRGDSLHASPGGLICETASVSEIDTLEAFHTAQASDEELQGALARAMGQFRGAQAVSGFTDAQSERQNAPPHVSRRYVAAAPSGDRLFIRIAYSQVGDWFVLQRVISTPDSAQIADSDGERRLIAAIGQLMDRQTSGGGR